MSEGRRGALPGEDVVRDGRDAVLITQSEAELEHQGGFARSNRSSQELSVKGTLQPQSKQLGWQIPRYRSLYPIETN